MNSPDRETRLLSALDILIFVLSTVALALFVAIYFIAPHVSVFGADMTSFVQSLSVNLIPIPLLFVVSYAVLRRIQSIRDERELDVLSRRLADYLSEALTTREAVRVLNHKPPASRESSIRLAREIWLVGVTLNKTVHNNFALLRNRLLDGKTMKVLLVRPDSRSIDFAAKRKIDNIDPQALRHYVNLTLLTLCRLRDEFPHGVEIRVIDYPLSFGVVAADINLPTGRIYVEHYFFKTDREGLYLTLRDTDSDWYDYYHQQIEALWEDSEVWQCEPQSVSAGSEV